MQKASVFDDTYRGYLSELSELDLSGRADILGVEIKGDAAVIPFFRSVYTVSPTGGVTGPDGKQPIHAISVVLLKYLILCPDSPPADDDWVSYRDFKDAAPFAGAFANNTERAIAEDFSGQAATLAAACGQLGGIAPEAQLDYDVAREVSALPRVPLLMLFNDADDEFPAQCSVLFQRRAEKFLDMECLAIVGWLFSDYLARAAGKKTGSTLG